MSPIWPGKSASVEAAMRNMLAAATQDVLDLWDPFDDEDRERKGHSQGELDELDRAAEPPQEGDPPAKGKHKADKRAAKALHERVIYYKTESDRKRRIIDRRNNGYAHAHTGTVDGYMQGHPIRQIDAPPRSPTEDSHNPHHFPPPQEQRRRGFSIGGLFRPNKKKPLPPPSPVIPHNEGSLDSYEERHPRQVPPPPPPDVHHAQYHPEPASPSKLLKRNVSTSSKTRGYDNHPPPQMHNRTSSRDDHGASGDHYDRPHRSSSHRYRDRDRDRDRDRERDRDRDRGAADPSRNSRRHDKSYSYDDRRYPPSSRRDLGGSDRHGQSKHREPSRERDRDRERSSRHRDDDYRQGSSNRHRSSHKKYYSEDDEDPEERRRRRREKKDRDRDHDKRRHDDPTEGAPGVHEHREGREGSYHGGDAGGEFHGGDTGGDFHDAPSLHESEHRPRDDHDALSVSDHLNGGLHVSG